MPTIAYRAVRSRRKFSEAPKVKAQLAAHLDGEVKPYFISKFDAVVADWEHRVDFKGRKFIRVDKIWVNVFPAGENKQIWIWVTLGTRPHVIEPRNAPVLAFQLGYQPHTRPIGKYGGPGQATGEWAFARRVNHPGGAARLFEKTIKDENKPWYSRSMENAWRRIIRSL